MPGLLPPPSSSSQSLPFAPPASSSLPPPPGFSHPPSSSFPVQGSSTVHGLGVGVPSSSGVPPSPFYSSATTASAVSAPASWAPAYPYDPYATSAPLADEDERFPDDIHNPLDPSAPPLSLDSARSEYRRMIDYVCGLFPQAAGVPPAPRPPALFESFFAPAAPVTPSLNFNWFDRVRTALEDADSCLAVLLASGRPEVLALASAFGFVCGSG